MALQHHSHVHLPLCPFALLLLKAHRVLILNVNIFKIRHYAQHRYTADALQHPSTLVEEAHVASELVDDDAFYEFPVLGCLQHNAAIDRGKDTATINVAHQNHIGMGMSGHRKIHQISISQIDFSNAAGALHHDGIVAGRKTIEGRAYLGTEINRASSSTRTSAPPPIVIGIAVPYWPATEHHLRGVVALGLQQQRVHVRMTGNAGGLGLHSLSTTYLQPFRCGVGVQCHVLRLERCRRVAVLLEDAAQSCRDNALANIAASACQHHGVQSILHVPRHLRKGFPYPVCSSTSVYSWQRCSPVGILAFARGFLWHRRPVHRWVGLFLKTGYSGTHDHETLFLPT